MNVPTVNTPKVSVIVPVYNVAPFIERCAESLFKQTIDDIEIIFIDDCSPDNSLDIIKKTLNRYPHRVGNVRIIKMPVNGGLAAVRKKGILEARGEYIIHCDGDDWVDIDLYSSLYNKAVEEKADIVVCGFIYEFRNKRKKNEVKLVFGDGKALLKNWYRSCIHMSCCNKLVRRQLYISNDVYPWIGLNMWEDNGLLTRLFYYSDKISYIDNSFYHYNRYNDCAMTSSYSKKNVEQMLEVAEHLRLFFSDISEAKEYEKTSLAFLFLARINLIADSFEGLSRYKNTFRESDAIISEIDTKAFSNKGRIRFYMVKYHMGWLFVLLFKLFNRIVYIR